MDSRERIHALLRLEEADRVGFVDFPWGETIDRWRTEGLPRTALIHDYFGMDIYIMGVSLSPKYDEIVLEEGDDWRVVRDSFGVKVRYWRGRSGTPHAVEPAVRTLDDFKDYIEPMLDPEMPIRVSSSRYPFKADLEKAIRRLQKKFFVCVGVLGVFEYSRHILGDSVDKIPVHMYRNPRMVEYIFRKIGDFAAAMVKPFAELGADGIWIWEDMAYRNGPFFSPRAYHRLLEPIHSRIIQPFRSKGLPAIIHSDGDIRLLIPHLIEAGFTAIQPMEAKAGMDVRELKPKYGDKLAFIGNIDARTLSSSKEAIREEVLSKLRIGAQGGGYIVGSDHSVPPTVSLENYMYFVNLVRKYGKYPLKI